MAGLRSWGGSIVLFGDFLVGRSPDPEAILGNFELQVSRLSSLNNNKKGTGVFLFVSC
jgi:hypothetical protein